MSSKKWQEYKLGELVDISSSKRIFAKEYCTKGIPFYRGKEIIEKFKGKEISTELFISKERYLEIKEKFGAPNKGDILLSSVGTLGIPYFSDGHDFYFKDGNLTWIKNYRKNCFNKFIYYWLQSSYGINQINSRAIGSTQKALTIDTLKKFDISLPSVEEQKVIAKILSDLDEKIEINNKINDNLEKIAQAIFKQWFIDFEFPNENGEPYKSSGGEMIESELGEIPKGWSIRTIGDLSSVVSKGTTPTKNDIDNAIDDNIIKFIKVKDISSEGVIDLSNIEYIPQSIHFNKLKRSVLEYKDILLSIAGTIGRVSYVDKDLVNSNTNQAVAFIRLTDIDKFFLLVLYKFRSDDFQNSLKAKVVQGVQANISLTVIKNEKIIVPNNKMLEKYNNIINNIFNKKDLINIENNRLKSIRDILLPKLMSGEIRVPLEEN